MGYDAASLLDSLGGTPVANGMRGLDETALRNALTGYAGSLKTALLTTYRGKNLKEIFGGHERVGQSHAVLPTAPAFPFSLNGASYSEFPDHRKHYFRFKYSTIDALFATADVNPRRLYLTFDNERAELFLDGTEIAEEASAGSADDTYSISIDHPYLADLTSIDGEREALTPLKRDTRCLVVSKHFAATFHDRWFNKILDETRALRAGGAGDGDIRMLSRNLELYGIAYNIEKAGFFDLITRVSEPANAVLLQDAGMISQDTGFWMDWPVAGTTLAGYEGWDSATHLAMQRKIVGALSYFGSAFEHNIIDQLQEDQGGVSTVRGLSFANDDNQELYFLGPALYQAVRPTLLSHGWPAHTLASADSLMASDPGARLLIHRDYGLASPVAGHTWTGGVYWALPSDAIGGLFLLSGVANGGSSARGGLWSYILAIGRSFIHGIGRFFSGVAGVSVGLVEGVFGHNPTSSEPVDLATGAYLSEHTDLELGEGALPKGLRLTRSYNSLRRHRDHELGHGWSHSLDVHAARTTHLPILFGGRLPVDTTAQIVGAHVAADLAGMGQDDLKEVMALMMTSHWATDEIVDNAVAVQTGHQTRVYSRQPDGSFTSPPGVTDALSLSGDDFVLSERHGRTYRFTDVNGAQRLSTVADPHGNTANFTYDASHRLSKVSDCFSRSITFHYDSATGRLASLSDSTGRSIGYTFDSNGDQTAYTNADSQQFTFAYDTDHQITEWTDNEGRTIAENIYNSLGQVITQYSRGESDREWTFLHTGFENIEQDPLGNRKRYFFDGQLNLVGFEDGEGNRVSTEYNVERQPVRRTGPAGNQEILAYDSGLNLASIARQDADGTLLRQRSFVYDADKRLQTATNARGYTTRYTYNDRHQVLTVQRQDETGGTGFSYNDNGTLAWTEDPDDRRTTFGYDNYHNVNLVTFPDGATNSAVFDARGDPLSRTDARGKTTSYQYNNRRLETRRTNPLGHYAATAYNGLGRPVSLRGFRGATTTRSYDALGNLLRIDHPLLDTDTVHAYDRADRLVSVTSPGGVVRTRTLDRAGRIVARADPVASTATSYDARGLVQAVTDPLGRETTYARDALGQLQTVTNPLSGTVLHSYDANGNRVALQNPRGHAHAFHYDSLDRLQKETTPGGRETAITYTSRHEVDVVTRPSGQASDFGYDSRGRLASIDDGVGTRAYTRDANGNITAIAQGDLSVSFTYDDLNRVTSHTDENGNRIGYAYDANGNMTRLTYPGDLAVNYTYDALDRMTSVTDWDGRQTRYTYDADSRLLAVVRPNGTTRRLAYDAAGRLVQVVEEDARGYLLFRSDLALDAAGRIAGQFRIPRSALAAARAGGQSGGSAPVSGWSATHDPDDRLLVHSAGPVAHDADGNLVQAPLAPSLPAALGYNARNQLVSVAAASAAYRYGIEGRRLGKTVAGTGTAFVTNPLGRFATVLAETAGGHTRYYVYGLGLLYQTAAGGSPAYHHFDHAGNTVALTAADGVAATARFEYSPYGETVHREGQADTPFRFNGLYGVYTDDETGLVHMRARYYSPFLKRFLTRDPAGLAGGLNPYAFADSNPLSFVDPMGLGPQSAFDTGRNLGRAVGNAAAGPVLGTIDYFTENWQAYHPNGNPASSRGIHINGILGDNNANHQAEANEEQKTIVFNPSNGLLADIVQAAWGIFTFGLMDSGARSAGRILSNPSLNPIAVQNITAHSQSTVHLTNSVFMGMSPNIQATLNSPAIPSLRVGFVEWLSGSELHYNQPFGDIAAIYSPSLNPLRILSGLNIFTSVGIHMDNATANHNKP